MSGLFRCQMPTAVPPRPRCATQCATCRRYEGEVEVVVAPFQCRRCIERGKTWPGADPACGFDERGQFVALNWNCATLNALRDLVDEYGVRLWSDDSNAALLAEPEHDDGSGGHFVVLEWYKSRGCTEIALILDGGNRVGRERNPASLLTLEAAERMLDLIPGNPSLGDYFAPHPYVGGKLRA